MRYVVAILIVALVGFGLWQFSASTAVHATRLADEGAPLPLGTQVTIFFAIFVARWFVIIVGALLVLAIAVAHRLGSQPPPAREDG